VTPKVPSTISFELTDDIFMTNSENLEKYIHI
jgi:hypothetical protein